MKSPVKSSVAIYSTCKQKCAECLGIRKNAKCTMQHNTELCRTDISLYMKKQIKINKTHLSGVQSLTIKFRNPRISEDGPLIIFFQVEIVADSNVIKRCELNLEIFLGRNGKSKDPNRCHTYLLSLMFEELDNLLSSWGYEKISTTKDSEAEYKFIYNK